MKELNNTELLEVSGGEFNYPDLAKVMVTGGITGGLGGSAVGGIGAVPGAVGGALLGGIGYTGKEILNEIFD